MLYTGFDSFRKTFCRDDRIRTCGPYVPNVVRYRAALHPALLKPPSLLILKSQWLKDLFLLYFPGKHKAKIAFKGYIQKLSLLNASDEKTPSLSRSGD